MESTEIVKVSLRCKPESTNFPSDSRFRGNDGEERFIY